VGFTATTARGYGKDLDTVFESIVYSRSLPDLIAYGYLSKLRGYRVTTTAHLTRLSGTGLNFQEDEGAHGRELSGSRR
jgi:ATP-dependent helicase IRC3